MDYFKFISYFLLKFAPFNIALVFLSMEQPLATMALARLGGCCRSLLLDSSKAAFYGAVQPAWIVSCVGGETSKTF